MLWESVSSVKSQKKREIGNYGREGKEKFLVCKRNMYKFVKKEKKSLNLLPRLHTSMY